MSVYPYPINAKLDDFEFAESYETIIFNYKNNFVYKRETRRRNSVFKENTDYTWQCKPRCSFDANYRPIGSYGDEISIIELEEIYKNYLREKKLKRILI